MPSKRTFDECDDGSDDGGVAIRSRRARQPQQATRADHADRGHGPQPEPQSKTPGTAQPGPLLAGSGDNSNDTLSLGLLLDGGDEASSSDESDIVQISRPQQHADPSISSARQEATPTASTVHPEAQVPVTPKKKREAPAKDPAADVWAFFQTRREVGADPHIRCKICL
jgi:hypothetical protein